MVVMDIYEYITMNISVKTGTTIFSTKKYKKLSYKNASDSEKLWLLIYL